MSTAQTDRDISAPATAGVSYRPDIDGLRAIAVMGVVAYHSGLPGIPGGFVGVDVFFVISGFLITGLLAAEFERSGSISFRSFFVRRIRRLIPALALVVTATLAIAAISMFPRELHRVGNAAQAVATLTANIHFRHFTGGYFDPSTDVMPLLHTWSLAVEEQYYLAWPVLFLLTHRLWRPRAGGPHRTTIATLIAVAVASFIACLWMTKHDRLTAFYLTPYRAWEFALGALLSYASPYLRDRLTARAGNTLLVIGLIGILATMTLYDDRLAFPGAIALVPVLGSVATIAGGLASGARLPTVILGNRIMVGIGLISYSLYLWHWPLLALARDYDLGNRSLPRDLGIVALSVVLAWFTYRYIENPIRRHKPGSFATPRGTLWTGFAISMAVIAAANWAMYWSKGRDAELNERARAGISTVPMMSDLSRCQQPQDGHSLPAATDCLVGSKDAPMRLLSWGDSHSSQFLALYDQVSRRIGFSTVARSLGSCPPLIDAITLKRDEIQMGCAKFNQQVGAELPQLVRNGLHGVVLAARWNAYLALPVTEPGGTFAFAVAARDLANRKIALNVGYPPLDPPGAAAQLRMSLHDTLHTFRNAGLRVVIIEPIPELYFNGPQCLYRRSDMQCTVPRGKVEARRALAIKAIADAAAGLENVRLYDPIDEFCDADRCYTRRHGMIMYGDDNHIVPAMAVHLQPQLEPLLKWAAEGINSTNP